MRYLVATSSLTLGSGLSRYVFSLCNLLSDDNEIFVVTTHDSDDVLYAQNELGSISNKITLISLGKFSTLTKYMNAIRCVGELKPDVIINNYNGVFQYILPFISRSIKVVHILHNDTDDFYRIASINGKWVTGWIAPTKAIADHYNSYTGEKYANRVSVISHGVEKANYLERHNSCLEIVYAGVLYEHKGVKILPEIIKRLLSQGVILHFTIIGKGILSDWLKDQFTEEIKQGQVTMTGVIAHNEVYRLMSKADIFLYPTRLDAFGLVIAEAMMNGAVPVVTHLPGITDNLIPSKQYGVLIPQDNIEKFVSIIAELDSDREHLKRLSENASQRAFESLSLHAMKKAYLKYLNNL